MKKYSIAISFLLIIAAIYWSFQAMMPQSINDAHIAKNKFSTERALTHVKAISEKPHFVGSANHNEVRKYITSELKKLELEVEIQEGYTGGDWGNLCKAQNIITKIDGDENGKALMLLTHYDSSPHSSLGASDAGSGVATILEGIRAFLSDGKKPKNDIIILFTDAEELGLNGAELFVNKHSWAKNVGLVLNFEARGSGGPSIMLIETNNGCAELVKHFAKANPKFPVGNSLAYSIYKMMPNDTDLTVFRENANIQGYNFAFIDDHFDYHSALDNYERLDKNTLKHQGSYLMPLLKYFSETDLSNLKSDEDYAYINVPVFKLLTYPFSWIFPMLIIALTLFLLLLIIAKNKNTIDFIEILKGFMPFILSLLICSLIGFYSWPILKSLYPHYNDNLHGFTYNGYLYICAFVALSVAICFSLYNKFKKIKTVNLVIAPILFWLVICSLVSFYLKGASFFILPAFASLASLYILIKQKKPNLIILSILAFPTLWILSPFIQLFPVGLGLKMMVTATTLTTLIFGLLTPIIGFYKQKGNLASLAFLIAFAFLLAAHFKSSYNADRPKPNSLLYVYDVDTNKAKWATYDHSLDKWVSQYLTKNKEVPEGKDNFSSKYNTVFSYTADAPLKNINPPHIEISNDTIMGDRRYVEICINPQRNITRLDVFADTKNILSCKVNGISFSDDYLKNRSKKLFNHYVSNNTYTDIELTIPKEEKIKITIYEASNDLLTNKLFTIPARPENAIPMPFVLNDAILIKKTIKL